MYVWLSCWAVSAVVCIESIPAYAGVVVCGYHFWLSCWAVVLANLGFDRRGEWVWVNIDVAGVFLIISAYPLGPWLV